MNYVIEGDLDFMSELNKLLKDDDNEENRGVPGIITCLMHKYNQEDNNIYNYL